MHLSVCHKLTLTQFWPEVVSWRFEITTALMSNHSAKRKAKQYYHKWYIQISPKHEGFAKGCFSHTVVTHTFERRSNKIKQYDLAGVRWHIDCFADQVFK